MAALDITVDYLAQLARLQLKEDEKENMAAQIGEVLQAAEKIQELNTENVMPTAHLSMSGGKMRSDVVQPSMSVEEVMANVPRREDSLVRVPRISQ